MPERALTTTAAGSTARAWLDVARMVARRQRWRTVGWSLMFALLAAGVLLGFDQAYNTAAGRMSFARLADSNAAFRILNGLPYKLDTREGFITWRISSMSVFGAAWALLATTRLLRGEEDAGRFELLVAGRLTQRAVLLAVTGAIALQLVPMAAAVVAMLWLLDLPLAGSTAFAAAFFGPALCLVGIGALLAQLAPTRRVAAGIGGGLIATMLVLRMLADASPDLEQLRMLTPFGWYELARPFHGLRWWVLAADVALATVALALALVVAGRRDLGAGVLRERDVRASSLRLLGSPLGLAVREGRTSLAWWMVGTAAMTAVMGWVARDVADVLRDATGVQQFFAALVSPAEIVSSFMGMLMLFVMLIVSAYATLAFGAIRDEESSGRLENVLARTVSRQRWLCSRVGVVALGAVLLTATAAVSLWAGARLGHVNTPLDDLLVAAAADLPVALVFLGIATLAFGTVPRASVAVAGGSMMAAFVWNFIGSIAEAPDALLAISPFFHLSLAPAEPVDVTRSLLVLATAGALFVAGLLAFGRRDITGE